MLVRKTGPEPFQTEQIRQRAHELWEQEGRPEGRHEEHWARARRELEGRDLFVEVTATHKEKEIEITPAEQQSVEAATWASVDEEPKTQRSVASGGDKPDALCSNCGSLYLDTMRAGYEYALGKYGKRHA